MKGSDKNLSETIEEYRVQHYIHRSNWLRAAVLGANDGILSTASLAVGVAAASDAREPLVLATLAGLVAGALSMAAGEYVSVSSQTDIEKADIEREQKELEDMPEIEKERLADIYENRGLRRETAVQVAEELTAHDALGAHVRDELGINDISQAKPLQASIVSGLAFSLGALLPFLVTVLMPLGKMEYSLYIISLVSLILLGAVAAKAGGSSPLKAVSRITIWGTAAMGLTLLVGYLFGASI